MVERLNEYTDSWKVKMGKQHLRPEADITKVADSLLREIDGIQIKHVKGHQDS